MFPEKSMDNSPPDRKFSTRQLATRQFANWKHYGLGQLATSKCHPLTVGIDSEKVGILAIHTCVFHCKEYHTSTHARSTSSEQSDTEVFFCLVGKCLVVKCPTLSRAITLGQPCKSSCTRRLGTCQTNACVLKKRSYMKS